MQGRPSPKANDAFHLYFGCPPYFRKISDFGKIFHTFGKIFSSAKISDDLFFSPSHRFLIIPPIFEKNA